MSRVYTVPWGVGSPTYVHISEVADPNHDSVFWNFGIDATPATLSGKISKLDRAVVKYSSGGIKTITARVTNGVCSKDTSFSKYVNDCTFPVIPHTALVINRDTSISWSDETAPRSIWINPGVTVNIDASGSSQPLDSVFAETGVTITGRSIGQKTNYYLKVGVAASSFELYDASLLIWQDAVALPQHLYGGALAMQCPGLDFDYSTAPPNIAFQPNAVSIEPITHLQILPNPTSGSITITNVPEHITKLEVYDLLGHVVSTLANPTSSTYTVDLSHLLTGTYYLRASTISGVISEKIIKN